MDTPLLEPLSASEWSATHARHLLNRAGFGQPRDLEKRLAAMAPEAAVDCLVDYESVERALDEPDFLTPPDAIRRKRDELAFADDDARRRAVQEIMRDERESVERLKAWWLERMLTTPRPLEEKMALFWHGHFATSAQKVKSSYFNYQLNDVFRMHATGNLKALTIAVGQSPAMLRYLDNVQSTKKQPNENWARELMELFTLGKGHYTESDIKNSARAFTGWSADENGFKLREELHDFGAKTFMGRTGDFDGWDIVNIIFEQPATAEFISAKLWTFFAYESPQEAVTKGLAETMRASHYELKPVLRRLFLSKAFYSDRAMGTQVKSPAQFAVQLAHDLDIDTPPYRMMARGVAQLGQDLFYPPNVKGWDGNRAWVNANMLLMRYNMPIMLVATKAARDGMAMMERREESAPDSTMESMDERRRMRPEPWDGRKLVAELRFDTAAGCVEALEQHFLSVPLSAEQRRALVAALGAKSGAGTSLQATDLPDTNIKAVLHLLLSTAEYQLC